MSLVGESFSAAGKRPDKYAAINTAPVPSITEELLFAAAENSTAAEISHIPKSQKQRAGAV